MCSLTSGGNAYCDGKDVRLHYIITSRKDRVQKDVTTSTEQQSVKNILKRMIINKHYTAMCREDHRPPAKIKLKMHNKERLAKHGAHLERRRSSRF